MKFCLGIDQGGTKTAAVLTDENMIIHGMGIARGACHVFDGIDTAVNYIWEAAALAMKQAGVTKKEVVQISAGITGTDWPEEYETLEKEIRKIFPEKKINIYNDCIIGLYGGPCLGSGAVLCAGTGLNVGVVEENGVSEALGYYINESDHAGMAMGKMIFQSVINTEIGLVPETILTKQLLRYYDCRTREELLRLRLANNFRGKEYKELVPMGIEAANQGDKVAQYIMKDFGYRMSRYLPPLLEKHHIRGKEVKVVLTGGIFKKNKYLIEATKGFLIRELGTVDICEAILEPVAGAALAAYRDYNLHFPERKLVNRFVEICKSYRLIREN